MAPVGMKGKNGEEVCSAATACLRRQAAKAGGRDRQDRKVDRGRGNFALCELARPLRKL